MTLSDLLLDVIDSLLNVFIVQGSFNNRGFEILADGGRNIAVEAILLSVILPRSFDSTDCFNMFSDVILS